MSVPQRKAPLQGGDGGELDVRIVMSFPESLGAANLSRRVGDHARESDHTRAYEIADPVTWPTDSDSDEENERHASERPVTASGAHEGDEMRLVPHW